MTGQNIDHLSNMVQLVERIFNKYPNKGNGVSHLASNNRGQMLRDKHFITKITISIAHRGTVLYILTG